MEDWDASGAGPVCARKNWCVRVYAQTAGIALIGWPN